MLLKCDCVELYAVCACVSIEYVERVSVSKHLYLCFVWVSEWVSEATFSFRESFSFFMEGKIARFLLPPLQLPPVTPIAPTTTHGEKPPAF